jgi:hypothetical protein
VLDIDVDEDWLADGVDLRYDTLQIKCLGKNDFEDFLDVDGCGR